MTRCILSLSLLGALLASATACDTAGEGEQGNLSFTYDTSTTAIPFDFSTDLAKGLSVDIITALASAPDEPVRVFSVQSNNADLIDAGFAEDNSISLTGLLAGEGEIEVATTDAADTFKKTVGEIAKVTLTVPGLFQGDVQPPYTALLGGTLTFGFGLEDDLGQPLIGYGDLPIVVDPAGAATRVQTNELRNARYRFPELGTIGFTGMGDVRHEITVVPIITLNTLDWGSLSNLNAGDSTVVLLSGYDEANSALLGLDGLVDIDIGPSSVCTAERNAALGDSLYEITAVAPGTCELSATLSLIVGTGSFEVL